MCIRDRPYGESFTGALGRDAGNNVGLYNITQGSLALTGNYDLQFTTNVKFEIMKLVVTVTPTAGQNKFYGAADPTFAYTCLLYTSDAADERSSVDLGGRRIIK